MYFLRVCKKHIYIVSSWYQFKYYLISALWPALETPSRSKQPRRSRGGVRADGIDNEVHRSPCQAVDAEEREGRWAWKFSAGGTVDGWNPAPTSWGLIV